MTYKSGILTGVIATLGLAAAAVAGWWLLGTKTGEAKPAPPAVPATVPKPFKEDQAATVVLGAEGEKALKIQLGKVERKSVPRTRDYGGEVTVPPGRAVVVSAPLAGVLRPVPGVTPAAGLAVKKGRPVV